MNASLLKKNLVKLVVLFFGLCSAILTYAEERPMTVVPQKGADFSGAVVSGYTPMTRSYTSNMTVKWRASCYGTNIRSISNPIAPDSTLVMTLNLADSKSLQVACGAAMVKAAADTSGNCTIRSFSGFPSNVTKDSFSARYTGQEAFIVIPFSRTESISPRGEYKIEGAEYSAIRSASFRQEVTGSYSNRAYAPVSGVVPFVCGVSNNDVLQSGANNKSGTVTQGSSCFTTAPDQKTVTISTQFAGMGGTCPWYTCKNAAFSDGFCGSYYSPLMLFFTGDRPHFTGVSRFPLIPNSKVYWVEPGAPGYFLALNNRPNGAIESSDQLFGDNGKKINGFDALYAHDLNRDGLINSKDAIWKKLVLWNDRNGDGVSQKKEIFGLVQLGVTEISLKFESDAKHYWGGRALAFGSSPFYFKDPKTGQKKEGRVNDIWFSPAEEAPSVAEKR